MAGGFAPVILALVAALYLLLYLIDGRLKADRGRQVGYLVFLQKNGIDLKLFRVSWYTAAFNRLFGRIGRWRPRLLRLWFGFGAVVASLLVIPSLVLLVRTLCVNLIPEGEAGGSSGGPNNADRIVLQPVVPGVNMPMADLGYYFAALLACSAIHEAGHAVSAVTEDLRVLGFGFFALFVVPAAFVDLPTEQLLALRKWQQLKIFSAGVWHNVVLAAAAYALLFATPTLVAPAFFHRSGGVLVAAVTPGASVTGPTGLAAGDVIHAVNGCPVRSKLELRHCLVDTVRMPNAGRCASLALFEAGLAFTDAAEDGAACCHPDKSDSSLCFVEEAGGGRRSCLAVRPLLEDTSSDNGTSCDRTNPCADDGRVCVRPSLQSNATRLVAMARTSAISSSDIRRDFLFVGHPAEVYESLTLSDYVPKFRAPVGFLSWLLFGLPEVVETTGYYVASFSGALAVLNVVPCFFLDGQHMARVLVDILCPCYDQSTRSVIHLALVVVGTALLAANLLVGVWKFF